MKSQGIDIIIGLGHSGYDRGKLSGTQPKATGRNTPSAILSVCLFFANMRFIGVFLSNQMDNNTHTTRI